MVRSDAADRLFPRNIPEATFATFAADGFDGDVTGVVYSGSRPAANGLPLGGIETGCVDIETNGLLGYCSTFNSLVPRRGPLNEPFLGMAVGEDVWVLSTCGMPGVGSADEMHYFGHFPVADIEYDLDAPVGVSLRAWSPFIPGAVHDSNIPGAVFEVRLRNESESTQSGTVAFSFPGFDRSEVKYAGITREVISGPVNGIVADGAGDAYLIGVIDEPNVRVGGGIGWDAHDWQRISEGLPSYPVPTDHDNSAMSVSSDFQLGAGEATVIRFVLAWRFPTWYAGGTRSAGGNAFQHMYAANFDKVEDVAAKLATEHERLLQRTLAWQQVVYDDDTVPGWLQHALINSLHLIPETSLWAQATDPVGDWCRTEDGVFGMNECPRSCPQMECIPCTFYGSLPLVYFFPELALSTLRAYKAYQYDDGRPAWVYGGLTAGSGPNDMASPSRGYQFVLNGSCYAEIFNKLWLYRDRDAALLEEFYESIKKTTIFTMNLRPEYGVKQVISMPDGNAGQEWFESTQFFGMASHVGGVHLAHLQMAQEWAERMGDDAFAEQCSEWLAGGSAALEEHLWTGTHYRLYNEPDTGQISDVVMAYQLDGDWISRLHGFDGVFDSKRADETLATIARISASPELSPYGAIVFADPNGGQVRDFDTGYWTNSGTHYPSVLMLGMTYIYAGEAEFGIELARRATENILCDQRAGWDWGILYDGVSGERVYGNDYYQDLVIWSFPAALNGTDLAGPAQEGGLVDRILAAGR